MTQRKFGELRERLYERSPESRERVAAKIAELRGRRAQVEKDRAAIKAYLAEVESPSNEV